MTRFKDSLFCGSGNASLEVRKELGFTLLFQQLRLYYDEIETWNQEEIPFP